VEHCRDPENKTVPQACSRCKKRKLKCDQSRPCKRCVTQGCEEECMAGIAAPGIDTEGIVEDGVASPSSQIEEIESSDIAARGFIPHAGDTGPGEELTMTVSRPITFRGGSSVVPTLSGDDSGVALPSQIPLSFSRWLGCYRMSKFIAPWYAAFTPKLRRSVNRIFGFIDAQQSFQPSRLPNLEDFGPVQDLPESFRCGFQACCVNKSIRAVAQPNHNNFWTDLAGLHKEEYLCRTYKNEMSCPSSEFRTFCKFLWGFKFMTTPAKQGEQEEIISYGRFTKNWASIDKNCGDGVLTRNRVVKTTAKDGQWVCLRQAMVVISREEYAAAEEKHPECCDELARTVMGRKTVDELLSPKLLTEESMSRMSSTAEGRAKLDHLASILDDMFSFLPIRSSPSLQHGSPQNGCE